jgi:hypothetical protein
MGSAFYLWASLKTYLFLSKRSSRFRHWGGRREGAKLVKGEVKRYFKFLEMPLINLNFVLAVILS